MLYSSSFSSILGRLGGGVGGLDSTGSGQGPVAGCCECGDEPSGSYATELVPVSVVVWRSTIGQTGQAHTTVCTKTNTRSAFCLFLAFSSLRTHLLNVCDRSTCPSFHPVVLLMCLVVVSAAHGVVGRNRGQISAAAQWSVV
jgi:hypothetical protein